MPSAPCTIGCDLAKHTDFTVLIAMDRATGQCFDMDRFNHLEWPIQKERILAFAQKHHGRLILDTTGAGDPIYDDLARAYPKHRALQVHQPQQDRVDPAPHRRR